MHLRREERLDEEVALAESRTRRQPAESAPEGDEAHSVAAGEVTVSERCRGADRPVKGAFVESPRLGERVEEQHDVAAALRMALVDNQLGSASASTPVHRPDPIARYERTDVGELEPVSLGSSDPIADSLVLAER